MFYHKFSRKVILILVKIADQKNWKLQKLMLMFLSLNRQNMMMGKYSSIG